MTSNEGSSSQSSYNLEGFNLLAIHYNFEHRTDVIKTKMRQMLGKMLFEQEASALVPHTQRSSSPAHFEDEKLRFMPVRKRAIQHRLPQDKESRLDLHLVGKVSEIKGGFLIGRDCRRTTTR